MFIVGKLLVQRDLYQITERPEIASHFVTQSLSANSLKVE